MPPSSQERDTRFAELIAALRSFKADQFDPFDIYRTHYESSGTQIGVDVMVPKNSPKLAKRPVIVRIHGGFLVTGSSLFPAWFSKWILQYAEMHGAVIISPDYRLLPEVRGVDILNDMRAFWLWYDRGLPQKHLAAVGRKDVELDSSQLLLLGESAGGYLTIQSALLGYAKPKAMVALYPMLDMKSDHYNRSYEKTIVSVPNFPAGLIDDFLASSSGQPVTEADPPQRLDLGMAICHNGRYLEFLGRDPELFPMETIESLGREAQGKPLFPPFLITQGKDDTAVPAQGTLTFAERVQRYSPETKLKLVIRPGEHGFDCFAAPWDDWVKDALLHVNEAWLGREQARCRRTPVGCGVKCR